MSKNENDVSVDFEVVRSPVVFQKIVFYRKLHSLSLCSPLPPSLPFPPLPSPALPPPALPFSFPSSQACFLNWRDLTKDNTRRREIAARRGIAAQLARDSLGGTARCLFLRWKSWAKHTVRVKAMTRRTQLVGLRRFVEVLRVEGCGEHALVEVRRCFF